MKHWSIKKRIVAGFATTLALVATLTMTSHVLLGRMKSEAGFMRTDALPGLKAMAQIKRQVSEIQVDVLRALVATTPEDLKKCED
jgi:Four helix bundle sensory module for signal transduction